MTGYAPTPLISLPSLAEQFGVQQLLCKHEGFRFEPVGFRFKPTGVVYALARVLLSEIRKDDPDVAADVTDVSVAQLLLGGEYGDRLSTVTVCAATSGNHGRALAWGARLWGCRCIIYMGTGVPTPANSSICP